MKFVFLDDSVQRDPPRSGLGELIALGAVIVPEDQVIGFAADLTALKSELGIPVGEEIKWKSPKGSFLAGAGGAAVSKCRQRLVSAAIERGIKSVVHVVDHGRVYKEKSAVEVGQELLKWTYDKLAMALGGEPAVMIADKPGGGTADESRWLAETLSVTSDGTAFTAPGTAILPVLTAASHHVPHLQLADIITAATTAAVAGRVSGHELAPLLHTVAHKNSRGYAGGAGISLWPGELKDLLYWEFGEDTYVRAGADQLLGPTGSKLAAPGRPYRESSGLSEVGSLPTLNPPSRAPGS